MTPRRLLAASVIGAVLAGCAGSTKGIVLPEARGINSPYAVRAKANIQYNGNVFVSDYTSNAVWICPANFYDIRNGFTFPVAQLQGVSYPVQVAVDAAGTVYVANSLIDSSGASSVTIYQRGATTPSRTLTAGLNTSTGVAVDSLGRVYVSNKYFGSIEIFPKGKDLPSATITANLRGPDSLAVDKADNLYVADSSANDVLELARGSKTPESLHLRELTRPTGIAVDSRGTLYVGNLVGAGSYVAVYPAGKVQPSQKIIVRGPVAMGRQTIGEPLMLSIAAGDMLLASAFFSLRDLKGQWVAFGSAADGFMPGQSRPLWIEQNQNYYSNQLIGYDDAVFQPAQ